MCGSAVMRQGSARSRAPCSSARGERIALAGSGHPPRPTMCLGASWRSSGDARAGGARASSTRTPRSASFEPRSPRVGVHGSLTPRGDEGRDDERDHPAPGGEGIPAQGRGRGQRRATSLTRAIEARDGYASPMSARVSKLLEQVLQLSAEEREDFAKAYAACRESESDALDDDASDEALRRLRLLQQGGAKGRTVDAYFDELEARARAKSA